MKLKILELLKSTNRTGMDNLISSMNTQGFFTSPASTRFHGSFIGGLSAHSLGVHKLFSEKIDLFDLHNKIPNESVIICSLLHDICKAGAYIQTGARYTYNQFHLPGHATLSLERIQKHIQLTPLERTIIQYHMGYYGTKEFDSRRGEYSLSELTAANNNPITKLFYWCDDMESQFVGRNV